MQEKKSLPRLILPQDYYDMRQVMALLKINKKRYYELVELEDDPLPMRMFGWSTRGALAERKELIEWFKRNTTFARERRK